MTSDSTLKLTNTITKWGTITLLILGSIYLIVLSILVQDLKYPKLHPYLFSLETLLIGIGTGSIIFLMAYGRGDLNVMTVVEFFIIAIKFGLLHILFQFSGFYSYVFSYSLK